MRIKGTTVGDFYLGMKKKLRLRLVAGSQGLKRKIILSDLGRPGLIFCGYSRHFTPGRGQVLGKNEVGYLKELPARLRQERVGLLLKQRVPFCVVTNNILPPPELLEQAERLSIPVFRSSLTAGQLVDLGSIFLEGACSPRVTYNANLLEVFGVGIMILGKSGVGKSECALGLVERGHRLVSDDIVYIKKFKGEYLQGEAPELGRFHMEIRGLGIINVQTLFGAGCVRQRKRIDMAVTLEAWAPDKEYERLGLDESTIEVLKIKVPHLLIPVRPGRDLSLLIETAALNFRIKMMGYNSARELAQTVRKKIQSKLTGHARSRLPDQASRRSSKASKTRDK